MRYALHLPSVIAVLITGLAFTAHGAIDERSAIGIQYVNPRTFTDFSIHDGDIQYSASVFTKEITEDLGFVMSRRFPGHRLTLRFTNIDLAGDGTAGARSVRIVQTNRPARLSFEYVLQEESGRVVANGTQILVETPSLGRMAYAASAGSVPLEGRMLQNWLRSLSVAG